LEKKPLNNIAPSVEVKVVELVVLHPIPMIVRPEKEKDGLGNQVRMTKLRSKKEGGEDH